MGQSIIAPLPGVPGEPSIAPAGNAVTTGITTGAASDTQIVPQGTAATLPGSAEVAEFLTWGEVHAKTHVTYQLLYGTGILSSPGESGNTLTQTVNPGVTIALGRHWTLDYEPTLRFFSDKQFHNTVDHSVSLSGGTTYENWTLGLSQNYTRSDEPMVETGGQTGVQSYTASGNAAYQFNEKWSLEMNGGLSLSFVDQGKDAGSTNVTPANLSDSQDYFASQWMNYQLDQKIGLAAGLSEGYSAQNGGLETANEQLLGRVTLRPGRKLSISVDGGVEDQQFLNSDAANSWSPIFAASVDYHVFKPTILSLAATRSVGTSLFQNQIVESTAVSLGLQQQLLKKLQLSLSYSYTTSDYSSPGFAGGSREDVGNSYQAALNFGFLKHGSIGAFYQYSQNSSTTSDFSFSSHQVGMTLTWAY